jgi:hypothetical protein
LSVIRLISISGVPGSGTKRNTSSSSTGIGNSNAKDHGEGAPDPRRLPAARHANSGARPCRSRETACPNPSCDFRARLAIFECRADKIVALTESGFFDGTVRPFV